MSEHAASETSKVSPLYMSITSLNTDGMFDRFKDSLGLRTAPSLQYGRNVLLVLQSARVLKIG